MQNTTLFVHFFAKIVQCGKKFCFFFKRNAAQKIPHGVKVYGF